MQRISKYWAHNRGAIFVLFAVLFPLLIALVGLSVDFAYVSVYRTRMQNAVDAAALAGAAQLGIADSGSTAKSMAVTYVQHNSKKGDTITQSSSRNFPSAVDAIYVYPTINAYNKDSTNVKTLRVEMRQQAPLFFLKYLLAPLGITTIPIAVVATGEYKVSQSSGFGDLFNYAIFGDQSIYFHTTNIHITGDLRTNQTITMDNQYAATVSNGGVIGNTSVNPVWGTYGWYNNQQMYYTVAGGSNYTGVSYTSSKDISLTTNSTINTYVNNIANMSTSARTAAHIYYDTSGNTFNSYTNTISGYTGITNQYNTTYTVIITTGDIQANVLQTLSGNLILISLNGNISLQNSVAVNTLAYAPNGTIKVDGSGATVTGSIVGKYVTLTTSGQNIIYSNLSSSSGSSSSSSSTKLIADDGSNEDTGS